MCEGCGGGGAEGEEEEGGGGGTGRNVPLVLCARCACTVPVDSGNECEEMRFLEWALGMWHGIAFEKEVRSPSSFRSRSEFWQNIHYVEDRLVECLLLVHKGSKIGVDGQNHLRGREGWWCWTSMCNMPADPVSQTGSRVLFLRTILRDASIASSRRSLALSSDSTSFGDDEGERRNGRGVRN